MAPSWPRLLLTPLLVIVPAALHGQVISATGTLTAVWGDPHPTSSDAPALHWTLVDDRGQALTVELDDELLRRAGGVRALDRVRVELIGVPVRRSVPDPPAAPVPAPPEPPVLRATGLERVRPAQPSAMGPHVGSQPYAVLLCKFADVSEEPRPPTFFEALLGDGFPNVGHYYREISAGQMDLTGTRVFGWFALPHGHGEYVEGSGGALSLSRLADDCLAAAQPTVDFAPYFGVVLQFNEQLSTSGMGRAYGGARVVALDGESRTWPFLWLPLWATEHWRYGIYAHELGHSLGLPHSSGADGETYDSTWDVMSRPYLRWIAELNAWVPGHTIGFHKDLLGWIPPERKLTVREAADLNIRLEPHSAPGGNGTRLVEIPIPGTADFYTVEARARVGYDRGLLGEAVLIHRVPDVMGPDCTLYRCAQVMSADGAGPNGPGATWLADQTFHDEDVRISVIGTTDDGWELAVSVTAPARPSGLTVERAADAVHGVVSLTAEELGYLDWMGNRNGRYDVGDFLSLLRREDR